MVIKFWRLLDKWKKYYKILLIDRTCAKRSILYKYKSIIYFSFLFKYYLTFEKLSKFPKLKNRIEKDLMSDYIENMPWCLSLKGLCFVAFRFPLIYLM